MDEEKRMGIIIGMLVIMILVLMFGLIYTTYNPPYPKVHITTNVGVVNFDNVSSDIEVQGLIRFKTADGKFHEIFTPLVTKIGPH